MKSLNKVNIALFLLSLVFSITIFSFLRYSKKPANPNLNKLVESCNRLRKNFPNNEQRKNDFATLNDLCDFVLQKKGENIDRNESKATTRPN